MKKPILLFLITLLLPGLTAQYLEVLSVDKQEFPVAGGYFYPQFGHDGSYLLLTSANYSGLKKWDLNTRLMEVLTAEPGAGYAARLSEDGGELVFTKIELVNKLRHNSLHRISLVTGEKQQLTEPGREAITPAFAGKRVLYVKAGKLQRGAVKQAEIKSMVTIENRKMVVYSSAGRKIIDPLGGDASYIWPSISPDGTKLLFTAAGRGTYVSTLSGKNAVALGKLNAPVWLSNTWVVGMDDKDDGGRVVESVLWLVSADGHKKQQLTTASDFVAMYPAVSPGGDQIAFNTDKGEVYILNIKLR